MPRSQFSLKTVFVAMTIAAVGCLADPGERQRRAVATIKALQGRLVYAEHDWPPV